MKKINVAVIGMNFGKEFVKLYQAHPNVGKVAICQRNPETLRQTGRELGVEEDMQFTDFDEVCASQDIDAIHIITPILDHYKQSLASLNAGKHTACTVPMATSIEELQSLCDAQKESGKVYMMMETAVYTREYLYVKNLVESGQLGRIQFVRGSHMQDMGLEGWPEYWLGFPPFWYGTHAISPLLLINNTLAEYVVGHGSGHISDDLAKRYGSPFACETLTLKLKDTDIVAEATRALYETCLLYTSLCPCFFALPSRPPKRTGDSAKVLFPYDRFVYFPSSPSTSTTDASSMLMVYLSLSAIYVSSA